MKIKQKNHLSLLKAGIFPEGFAEQFIGDLVAQIAAKNSEIVIVPFRQRGVFPHLGIQNSSI